LVEVEAGDLRRLKRVTTDWAGSSGQCLETSKAKHVTTTRGMGNLVWTVTICRELLQANVAVRIRRNYEHNPQNQKMKKGRKGAMGCWV
jgi:hypothetical protein